MAALALAEVTGVLLSVLRSVVLPRAVPARLARLTFLIVRFGLLARLRGRTDYLTRDRVLALQAPLGLFAQLLVWALLTYVGFAALLGLVGDTAGGDPLARTLELSGSSMLTLGFDLPTGWSRISSPSPPPGWASRCWRVITYLPSGTGCSRAGRRSLPSLLCGSAADRPAWRC